jgi:hypothetical protein
MGRLAVGALPDESTLFTEAKNNRQPFTDLCCVNSGQDIRGHFRFTLSPKNCTLLILRRHLQPMTMERKVQEWV